MLKKILKWTLVAVVVLAAAGFAGFLYFIPPLTMVAPEEFVAEMKAMAPAMDGVTDPAERARAEHGRYLVLTNNCAGCHVTQGPQGPDPSMYLAGGMTFVTNTQGTTVSRNLTPDRETGLGGRTDADIIRVLRSGVYPDGTPISHRAMPWSAFSNWSDEDLRDVIAYLRQIKPIRHAIPARQPGRAETTVPGSAEVAFASDAGKK
jgi:mono/diheme cytochrome c family protein